MSLEQEAIRDFNRKKLKTEVAKDVDNILLEMNRAGFWTQKGSNTYLLASIMADFVNKAIRNRKSDLGLLSLWESQDLAVVAPLMYLRYRIYNMRHHPKAWDISSLAEEFELDLYKLKLGDSIPNFKNLKYTLNGTAANMDIVRRSIGRLDNIEPTPLGIDYDTLLAGSQLTIKEHEFYECSMSETGVFIENDFLILPDENNKAVFYPITDFKYKSGIDKGTLTLTLFTKPKVKATNIMLPVINEPFESDPDFLRFLLTQLMAKFPIYRGYDIQDLIDLIIIKYKKPTMFHNGESQDESYNSYLTSSYLTSSYLTSSSKPEPEIAVNLSGNTINELNHFADLNVFEEVKISRPRTTLITIVTNNSIISKELEYWIAIKRLNTSEELYDLSDIENQAYKIIDEFLIDKYGMEASRLKESFEFSIETERFVHPAEVVSDEEYELESSNITRLYFESVGND